MCNGSNANRRGRRRRAHTIVHIRFFCSLWFGLVFIALLISWFRTKRSRFRPFPLRNTTCYKASVQPHLRDRAETEFPQKVNFTLFECVHNGSCSQRAFRELRCSAFRDIFLFFSKNPNSLRNSPETTSQIATLSRKSRVRSQRVEINKKVRF